MKEIMRLRTPIEVNGKSVSTLEYDFEEITCELYTMASTYADAKTLLSNQQGRPSATVMEQNVSFHMYLGMMAILTVNPEIDITDLERIKGSDLIMITMLGRNFTIGRSAELLGQSGLEGPSEATPDSITPESKKLKK
ncbi:MAG: early nodulin 20 (N-20) [Ruminococcus sp.]|nr:early nodulin 20 (N-20) [Ruminococcus sp.]